MFHKHDYGTCNFKVGRQLEVEDLDVASGSFNRSAAFLIILLELCVVLVVCVLPKSQLTGKVTHLHKSAGLHGHHASKHTV